MAIKRSFSESVKINLVIWLSEDVARIAVVDSDLLDSNFVVTSKYDHLRESLFEAVSRTRRGRNTSTAH